MPLNQKLLLFLPRVDSFWANLAGRAALPLVVVFFAILNRAIQIVDVKESLSIGLSLVISCAVYAALLLYVEKLNQVDPDQSFKLHHLVLPKRAYSLKMWVSDTPYAGVFVLIVILWLAFYGWYFGQSSPSSEDIVIAFLSMVFLGSLYVFCVLVQGYRDFFNDETVLEELSKHHTPLSSWTGAYRDFWRFFLIMILTLAVLVFFGELIMTIIRATKGYWF